MRLVRLIVRLQEWKVVGRDYFALFAAISYYAPITVMPHPPRLVVGGDFEGGLTPAACPLEGYCTFTHMCSTDLTKETAPVEGT